jgi:DNA polymerase-4
MDGHSPKLVRKIIHIDMDAFYASVEQRDNPALKGKPIAVGGSPNGRGGVVATASYEARKFGVRSAMPSKKALQLCKHIIFVFPRFEAYKKVSLQIREIFYRYTDKVEPLSLDEAYLDVTQDKKNIGSALEIAKQIKQAIKDELQLTASAGVSINKFAAKVASDMNKPDGLTFISSSKLTTFIEKLPIEKFYGVGKVTADRMKKMGLHTGSDLKNLTENQLIEAFGKMGKFFFNIVRGIDEREVINERETKSIGAEDTFSFDLTTKDEMFVELEKIAVTVQARLHRNNLKGRTVTLKIKYNDFKQITRSKSFSEPFNDLETIDSTAKILLSQGDLSDKKVRLLGISISNFNLQSHSERLVNTNQLPLF